MQTVVGCPTTERRASTGWNQSPLSAGVGVVWVPAGPLAQLGEETAVHLDLAGYPVCLARSQGRVHALLDICSHGQVALSDGDVEDSQVECWLHGSRFELAGGVPTGPPATRPVPVYPVRVIDGGIEVAMPATPAGQTHA